LKRGSGAQVKKFLITNQKFIKTFLKRGAPAPPLPFPPSFFPKSTPGATRDTSEVDKGKFTVSDQT